MAGVDLPKQTIIYAAGQPLTALHLITDGQVSVKFPGGEYLLGKGDVIGISEITSEVHFLTYTTVSDINMLTYPYTKEDMLIDLLQQHRDLARFFIHSAFRQIHTLLNICDISAIDANNLFTGLIKHFRTYEDICRLYRITPGKLIAFDKLDTSFLDEFPDIWLSNYYQGLINVFNQTQAAPIQYSEYVIYGFLRKAAQDFRRIYQTVEENDQHSIQLLEFYMNESCQDLFSFLSTLYFKLPIGSAECMEIYTILDYVIQLFQDDSNPQCQNPVLQQRINSFKVSVINNNAFPGASTSQDEATQNYTSLHDSLSVILEYADLDEEGMAACKKSFASYKALPNKAATSEEAESLRQEITTHFYTLYSMVAVKNLKTGDAPLPVLLFLYFGFMDEELAGVENCLTLVETLKQITASQTGIYAFYDWLKAIYTGQKEPSRNEYEEDFSDYIHKQKLSGTLSEADLRALSDNKISKVIFELRNMFPITNKMTYGRLSSFCPVFLAENAVKPLATTYVTAATLGQAITKIKTIDFSLFYRSILNPDTQSSYKETIHAEILPDIILMPNVGIHGVMWQEIEGKKRATPSRMVFSIFHMDDVYATMIRLAGEYRWEICKRIQGFRWNDITTPSLTSEYYDYIQFYRKNRSLSSEARERIKNSLQRAHNSFKEMFIRDYIQWIMFESTGSPRLNKVAREILFKYCPFATPIRNTLRVNPQYGDLCQRYDLKREQKLHHLNQFSKKLLLSNKPVPAEVEHEIEYYNK